MEFKDLIGCTLISITGATVGSDVIAFENSDHEKFVLHHLQDCCESVLVEDIEGDIQSLIGHPLTLAEEITSTENPPGVVKEWQYSYTWTFYKLATIKGYVTIRWYGESNGYYSESVDFVQLSPQP